MILDYRHEWKHRINDLDCLCLRQRLRAVMTPDPYAGEDGKYRVRSLYFDNLGDQALWEKLDGVNRREKFRIRCYNEDPSLIRLEKKSKWNGLGNKVSAHLTPEQVQAILDGNLDWMKESGNSLVTELHEKMLQGGLRPKTLVDYTREPFVFAPGNVRVTLDYEIRTGLRSTDFLNPDCVTIPAGDQFGILEVKYDEYLPDVIRNAVQIPGRRSAAFSKYAVCRLYDF